MKIQKGKKYIVWGLHNNKVKVTELYNRRVKKWFWAKSIPYVRYSYKYDTRFTTLLGGYGTGGYADMPLKEFEMHVIREVK